MQIRHYDGVFAKAKLDGFRSSPHERKITDIVLAVIISELIPTKVTFGDR